MLRPLWRSGCILTKLTVKPTGDLLLTCGCGPTARPFTLTLVCGRSLAVAMTHKSIQFPSRNLIISAHSPGLIMSRLSKP